MAIYPAPVLSADRPPGVAAPGDPFTLPPTISGGSTLGSVVAEWHREVSAGEKFGLTASGLTGAKFSMYSGGKFYDATLAGDDEFAEVLFPNYGQTWDFALGWAALQGGIALPIALNRTSVKWCQTSWTPGLTINFFGENLAHGNVENGAAYVAVQPVGGGEVAVYPATAANCHRVPFTVPNLAPGSYYAWLHNGHGGDYGWGKRLTVQVVANADHVKTHDFGPATRITLSSTDPAANDAKLASLYVQGCNLEVDPTPGPYPISKTVVIPSLSRLDTSIPGQALQFTVLPGTVWPANENRGMFGTNSATMVLLGELELLNPSDVNLNNNAAQGREVGLLTCANVTQFWRKKSKARWTAPYSEFQAGVVKAAEPVSCFRFKTSQHVFMDDCEDTGSGNPFIECSQVFMTNHSMVGTNNADHQLYGLHTKEWAIVGGRVRDFNPSSLDGVDRLIRVIKCGGQNGTNQRHYFEGIAGTDLGVVWEGVNQSPDANQFELNLYEGNTVEEISAVTASTATSVTTAVKLTYVDSNNNARSRATPGYHLVTIVKGKGRGQTRGIVSSTDYNITVDEPWNVAPDSSSVIQTSVFARDVTFYKVNYAGKHANSTDPRFTHNSFFNGFGGVHGFILDQCTGSYMRQGWSVISTQHEERFIDQSTFNVVKNSSFPHCRWGSRVESNPPVQTWKSPAPGVLALLDQNNTYDDPILSELVFQLPRDAANIGATPVVGLIRNKTKLARTVLNDYTPTFVDDPDFPPVPPLPQALKNFTQATATAVIPTMPILTVTKKNTYFRVLADLTLNLTNAPWLSNVLKVKGVTVPSSTGANAETAYTGAFGGLTPGGTLTKLVAGVSYQLVAGAVNGWQVPNAVEITVPTITSLNPLTVAPGDLLNVTGTNLLTTSYVLVGGVAAQIASGATTNTNVAVTVPFVAAGGNVAVVVITNSGNMDVSTLTVTGSGAKLAAPVVNQPSTITSSSFTITWTAVSGADGYRVRLNNGTLSMPGNVTSYTFSGLPAGALATADVQALDSTGAKLPSDYSNVVSATTTAAAPLSVLVLDHGTSLEQADHAFVEKYGNAPKYTAATAIHLAQDATCNAGRVSSIEQMEDLWNAENNGITLTCRNLGYPGQDAPYFERHVLSKVNDGFDPNDYDYIVHYFDFGVNGIVGELPSDSTDPADVAACVKRICAAATAPDPNKYFAIVTQPANRTYVEPSGTPTPVYVNFDAWRTMYITALLQNLGTYAKGMDNIYEFDLGQPGMCYNYPNSLVVDGVHWTYYGQGQRAKSKMRPLARVFNKTLSFGNGVAPAAPPAVTLTISPASGDNVTARTATLTTAAPYTKAELFRVDSTGVSYAPTLIGTGSSVTWTPTSTGRYYFRLTLADGTYLYSSVLAQAVVTNANGRPGQSGAGHRQFFEYDGQGQLVKTGGGSQVFNGKAVDDYFVPAAAAVGAVLDIKVPRPTVGQFVIGFGRFAKSLSGSDNIVTAERSFYADPQNLRVFNCDAQSDTVIGAVYDQPFPGTVAELRIERKADGYYFYNLSSGTPTTPIATIADTNVADMYIQIVSSVEGSVVPAYTFKASQYRVTPA